MRNVLRIASNIFIVFALCVIVVSGWHLYKILSNYAISEQEYDDLRKNTAVLEEKEPFDSSWGFTPGAPLRIDFDALKAINPDIVAWIYIPGLEISYPVLQGKTNDKYLHTTYKGTYAYAGAIFIDYQNMPDFSDRNTIIYGHNMNNGSMFGKLRRYVDLADPPFNPYVWIMTQDMNYCYRMFSSHISDDANDTYLLFDKSDSENFLKWEEKMKAQSLVKYEDYPFSKTDRVITLSTCHADHTHRRVVHALLIHSERPEQPEKGEGADPKSLGE